MDGEERGPRPREHSGPPSVGCAPLPGPLRTQLLATPAGHAHRAEKDDSPLQLKLGPLARVTYPLLPAITATRKMEDSACVWLGSSAREDRKSGVTVVTVSRLSSAFLLSKCFS